VVIKPCLLLGLVAEYRSRPWVWSTVVRPPSKVYDTHQRTKLTAPETISRSRDMDGWCPPKLNGSRDLATLLQGWFAIRGLALPYRPTYQIWSLYLHSLRIYERQYKMLKIGWNANWQAQSWTDTSYPHLTSSSSLYRLQLRCYRHRMAKSQLPLWGDDTAEKDST